LIKLRRRLPLVLLDLLRYVQAVRDHTVEQLCEIVVFDDERRTKPLEVISDVLTDPFTRPLSQRPNECKGSLWQNPDVGFADGRVHCLQSAFAMVALA
jgi:hypothetical protein